MFDGKCAVCGANIRDHSDNRGTDARPVCGRCAKKPAPRRAFVLNLNVGGDSWEDVLGELTRLYHYVKDNGEDSTSCGGGPTSGHFLTIRHDPEMTHDKYFEQINLWLKEKEDGDRATGQATGASGN